MNTTSYFHYYERSVLSYDVLIQSHVKNQHQLPQMKSIVLNTSTQQIHKEVESIYAYLMALELITGQKATLCYAKKAISNFQLRQNDLLGAKVTLRKHKMSAFLEKWMTIILPRSKEYTRFHIKKIHPTYSKNKKAYFNLGMPSLLIFPEIEQHFDLFQNLKGMNFSLILERPTTNYFPCLFTFMPFKKNES